MARAKDVGRPVEHYGAKTAAGWFVSLIGP